MPMRLAVASMIKTAFDMYRVDYNKIDGAIISSVVPPLNKTMQKALQKNGFEYCGIIYVRDGTPRNAYQFKG